MSVHRIEQLNSYPESSPSREEVVECISQALDAFLRYMEASRSVETPKRRSKAGEPLLTVEEAASRLRTTTKTIREKIRDGDIRAGKVGRAYLIRESELERLAGGDEVV